MTRLLIGAGLLLATAVVQAKGPSQAPVRFHASAMVEVDAGGVPQRVEPSDKLPAAVRDVVRQRVMQWRFEPVIVDGTPRTAATHVFLDACAVPQASGDMSIAMSYSWNGPGYADGRSVTPPLQYPPSAAMAGLEGSFRVVVKVEPDGSASVDAIEARRGRLKSFEDSLRKWVASMRYVPERVDGVPVATRIAIPVDFTLSMSSTPRSAREQATRNQEAPVCATAAEGAGSTPPVALDSPVKPRTTG